MGFMPLFTKRNASGIVLDVYNVQAGVPMPQLCMSIMYILVIFLAEH